ncbi:cysteine peptidase C50 [Crassisporium funariophilum]|nr:cysteine peptidase C50 [Crassisporium funariophilum]
MATTSRRPVSRQPSKVAKLVPSAADQLAGNMAKLTISNAKGKQRAEESVVSSEHSRLVSMRAVNAASQTLSGIIQSGWKRSSSGSSKGTLQSLNTASSAASTHIAILRRLCPDDIDVERAAASVLGKLVALGMVQLAANALSEMQPRMCRLYTTVPDGYSSKQSPSGFLHLLSLPEPPRPPTNDVNLTLISTYLLQALIVAANHDSPTPASIQALASTLVSPTTRSLLTWLPSFSCLPPKHVDSLLTRAYTTLTKLCSSFVSPTPNPKPPGRINIQQVAATSSACHESIFSLRVYALSCLISTSSGTIEANMFWDQATHFASALVKATSSDPSSEAKSTNVVLSAYSDLVQRGERRTDRQTFMTVDENARGFSGFCEYWMAFAKRAGDICVLQKINDLTQRAILSDSIPSSSKEHPATSSTPSVLETQTSRDQARKTVVEGTKICIAFGQLTALLNDSFNDEARDDQRKDLMKSIQASVDLLRNPGYLSTFLQPQLATNEKRSKDEVESGRTAGKIERAFERLRRSALKCLESNTSLPNSVAVGLQKLLHGCVSCIQSPSSTSLDAAITRDALTRSLDTLFVLSRTGLNPQDPTTFVPAFEHLSMAASILDSIPTDKYPVDGENNEAVDLANYTRCVSGAFYNLAGSLYQASRYGAAVPFLKESCMLGARALRLPRPGVQNTNETREKEWKQLEEQLFRRWELLAVCYSKNEDRKNAYSAYLQAIHTFPFISSGLAAHSHTSAPDALFGESATSLVKQLITLVDRVSYLGACDLLLPPEGISLRSAVNCATSSETAHGSNPTIMDACVMGALLERQLDSLEPSRWKEGVRPIFIQLLRDALDIYQVKELSSGMPVRRARILVRCMEFAYRDHVDDCVSSLGFASVDDIGNEVEKLAAIDDLGRDASLARYLSQYRISSHLWMAIFAHRRAEPEQNTLMSQHADEACQLIKELLSRVPEGSPKTFKKGISPRLSKKSMSPKVRRVVSPKPVRVTRQRVPAAPKKAAPVKKKAVLNPVTPKTRTALKPVSFNALKTPPRRSIDGSVVFKAPIVFDNFGKLLGLLQLTARILGLLALILPKARMLDMTRKLSERQSGVTSDGYVAASIDLAHEYVALGKMKRAATIFNQALEVVRSGQASQEISIMFLLRFAESLALIDDVPKSSNVYLEAQELSNQLEVDNTGMSTHQRIHARARLLEMAAMASHAFAAIQYSKGDIATSLEGLLQSIRLWNRAVETLARLKPPSLTSPSTDSDPFEMSDIKDALPSGESKESNQSLLRKPLLRKPPMDDLEWRLSDGLLGTLFSLSQAYQLRGSAREAEYFAQQAADLADQLNAPAMISRALAKKGEIQLQMGHIEDAHEALARAEGLLQEMPGVDTADLRRLKADYHERVAEEEHAQDMFDETVTMLEELDAAFRQFDNLAFGPRKSLGTLPASKGTMDVLVPELLASILYRQLWLLRDDIGDVFNSILEKFLSLSYSARNKAEENVLMAKLTLHSVYGRFRADMFLSSLTESTIAVPMGMLSIGKMESVLPSPDILDALVSAEKLLWAHLSTTAGTGSIIKVRDAAISLALIGAFQTSLGNQRTGGPWVIASLLDASSALSLRRDLLDAIEHKFPDLQSLGDLQWPQIAEGAKARHSRPTPGPCRTFSFESPSDSDEENDSGSAMKKDQDIRNYWNTLRKKYQSPIMDFSTLSACQTRGLPSNWTVINITVTQDKSALFVSRQEGGSEQTEPLIFCVPLNGRRDHGTGDQDENPLSFENAIDELKDIVKSSDESTKAAVTIKSDDDEAKSNWWKQRGQLDVRMRELLENIEYCWLGAFKATNEQAFFQTILAPRPNLSPELISDLRGQFEKVFQRSLHVKDKKSKARTTAHNKSTSQSQTRAPNQVTLDDRMIKCFSTLSPKCRDEELEDLVYFVLDLYQFHGVPVAIAEVDIDQVVVDLRTVLEEHSTKMAKQIISAKPKSTDVAASLSPDEHLFLVLDKNVQGLPWESMPILRGRSVSRIPGVDFLHDRVAFAKLKRESAGQQYDPQDGAVVDPCKGYYILNPSGDLGRTESRFRDWTKNMQRAGWDGVIGKPVSEQQFINALKTQDLVVYFGHGGGEQYVRSHKIRSLPTCAAAMLWGCSSGALREMGDFDRTGTPYNYMLAGCPTLIANLWDVTDKDIDKFSQSVFDKLSLTGKDVGQVKEKRARPRTSVVAAVAQSRDSCKLRYLTGAAPVVYGIPFYL